MTPAELCAVTAAARAAVYLAASDAADHELEPPHPAFVGFRRMTYIWVEGVSLLPIGDRAHMWLDFLRERGARSARLHTDGAVFVVRVATRAGTDTWRVDGDAAQLTMRGEAGGGEAPAPLELDAATRTLRDALLVATARESDAMRRAELQRARAILDSPDDGSEVSDIAWPYFILPPRGYGVAARRLMGAAAASWPAEPAGDDDLADAARTAVLAAANEPHTASHRARLSG
jgi:hypothetical protein